jgi:hypothetical protein
MRAPPIADNPLNSAGDCYRPDAVLVAELKTICFPPVADALPTPRASPMSQPLQARLIRICLVTLS